MQLDFIRMSLEDSKQTLSSFPLHIELYILILDKVFAWHFKIPFYIKHYAVWYNE